MFVNDFKGAKSKIHSDNHSCFKLMRCKRHIIMPPKYIGQMKKGLREHLDLDLHTYSERLSGVTIAYNNVQVIQTAANIHDDIGYLHFDIEADFIIFQPHLGYVLRGVANEISRTHIGCLVHDVFNASLLRPSDCNHWNGDSVKIGDTFLFEVTEIFPYHRTLSIHGKFSDKQINALPEGEHGDIVAHDVIIDDVKSTINRKRKSFEIEKNGNDENSASSVKKKTTKIRTKCEDLDEFSDVGKGLDDRGDANKDGYTSLKKEKRKEKKKNKHVTVGDTGVINNDVGMDSNIEGPVYKEKLEETIELMKHNKRKRKLLYLDADFKCDVNEINDGIENVSIDEGKKRKKRRKLDVDDMPCVIKNEEGFVRDKQSPRKSKKKKNKEFLSTQQLESEIFGSQCGEMNVGTFYTTTTDGNVKKMKPDDSENAVDLGRLGKKKTKSKKMKKEYTEDFEIVKNEDMADEFSNKLTFSDVNNLLDDSGVHSDKIDDDNTARKSKKKKKHKHRHSEKDVERRNNEQSFTNDHESIASDPDLIDINNSLMDEINDKIKRYKNKTRERKDFLNSQDSLFSDFERTAPSSEYITDFGITRSLNESYNESVFSDSMDNFNGDNSAGDHAQFYVENKTVTPECSSKETTKFRKPTPVSSGSIEESSKIVNDDGALSLSSFESRLNDLSHLTQRVYKPIKYKDHKAHKSDKFGDGRNFMSGSFSNLSSRKLSKKRKRSDVSATFVKSDDTVYTSTKNDSFEIVQPKKKHKKHHKDVDG